MINNKYFDICVENPLKSYNKIKKYFKELKPRFKIGFYKNNGPKILMLNSFDITWKDKWNTPRHEINPRISISLFNYIHINIDFTTKEESINDMVYWEAALYWLYYNKSLHRAVKNAIGWTQYNETTKKYEPIPFVLLKEPYQTMYINHELPIIKYEDTK